jgi:UDP-N-acetylmuramyl tripeptide synthase
VTVSHPRGSRVLSPRSSAAVDALKFSNWMSRSLRRGSGTVAGGRVGLFVDPGLLATLAEDRAVGLVSGTNGKTTTTKMLLAAVTDGSGSPVASNVTGANMPAGHVAALAGAIDADTAVLEVDEGYLPKVMEETVPRVVILLNLSRDQLDRISEVRMLVERWRTAMADLGASPPASPHGTVVVANADDPMVAWAASAAPEVRWVGAGQVWHNDAVGCPACGARIVFDESGAWACDSCDFARPARDAWLEDTELVLADGTRHAVDIALPGLFNRANAAMVAVAAPFLASGIAPEADGTPGLPVAIALERLGRVDEVAGRFSSVIHDGHPVRLLLAKNPAGWTAIFDLLDETRSPGVAVVLSINARIADGLDTSWLWDVPFERLSGRPVVVTGDRRLDLAVRLHYAEVAYTMVDDPPSAVGRAVLLTEVEPGPEGETRGPGPVDFLGNYTAFADMRKALSDPGEVP